jgi:hypothetical protein
MPTHDAFDILKPFMFLAAIAFAVGFFCYLALAPSGPPRDRIWPTAVSGPSSDDWNLIKHI